MRRPRYLHPGRASTRLVYRWLRRQRRLCGGDVYLVVEWPETAGELPGRWLPSRLMGPEQAKRPEILRGPIWQSLRDLERPCKLIDSGRCWVEMRTRCWHGKPWRRTTYSHLRGSWQWETDDRGQGLYYAGLLARLLRTAHREGFPLRVRVDP